MKCFNRRHGRRRGPQGSRASSICLFLTSSGALRRELPFCQHAARYEMIRVLTSGGRRWGVLTKDEQEIRSKATDMLLRDHVTSAKLARVAETLGSSQDEKSATLL